MNIQIDEGNQIFTYFDKIGQLPDFSNDTRSMTIVIKYCIELISLFRFTIYYNNRDKMDSSMTSCITYQWDKKEYIIHHINFKLKCFKQRSWFRESMI